MLYFPFEDPAVIEEFGFYRPDLVASRLQRLADAADRLEAADWPIWLIPEGLAFCAPDGCTDDKELEERLPRLGIDLFYEVLDRPAPELRTKAAVAIVLQHQRARALQEGAQPSPSLLLGSRPEWPRRSQRGGQVATAGTAPTSPMDGPDSRRSERLQPFA
jgi:hypothetical protein